MIKIEKVEVFGWEAAIRGMRNAYASWDKSDSRYADGRYIIGENDKARMLSLAKAGTDHAKYMRIIHVQCDITAPLYFLKQHDTYRIGVEKLSTSTMHNITDKEFELSDFSHEKLVDDAIDVLQIQIGALNDCRDGYLDYDKHPDIYAKGVDKKTFWEQIIQLLPESYNQRRTYDMSYQALRSMYHARKGHKLDEWKDFCKWCESLPQSQLITEV